MACVLGDAGEIRFNPALKSIVFGIGGVFGGRFRKTLNYLMISKVVGGSGGIRTHGRVPPTLS